MVRGAEPVDAAKYRQLALGPIAAAARPLCLDRGAISWTVDDPNGHLRGKLLQFSPEVRIEHDRD